VKVLHFDFETRSDLDLLKVGVYNYSRGRNTDLICAAYAFDDGEVKLWTPSMGDCPEDVFEHIESGGEVHAHNATFEKELCNNVGSRRYAWPHIYDAQLVCTMAQAFALGLPGGLKGSSEALGLAQRKDTAGYRLMLQYCQPRLIQDGKIVWWDDPEDLLKLYQYCIQDVVVEREVGKRTLKLSNYEKKVWELDQKINARGIKIDLPAALNALAIVESEKIRLIKEIQDASENTVATPQAVQQIKNFLALYGVDTESLAKADIAEHLDCRSLPPACRRVLEIRREAGKTSTAKLQAMLQGASPVDHRLRGAFQYSGANTRRWAGRKVQLQNLPRSKINGAVINDVLSELGRGQLTAEKMNLFYGAPLDTISQCLRGFLIADEGKEFLCSDFSAIEARVIAWLAGEESVLEIFRTHGKVYEHAASNIFGKRLSEITADERQIGKVAVLALGYQGGVGALQTMAKAYNVKLEPAYQVLWNQASFEQKDWVEKKYQQDKKKYAEISREEYIASDLTKTFWRIANPKIVEFWADLEASAIAAVQAPGLKCITARKNIQFLKTGSFLFCKLPSGGTLSYPYPQVETKTTPWKSTKQALTYMSEDTNHHWTRFTTYGGSISENVTQSFARDLLADAMLRLENSGFKVVCHTHDECVCESDIGSQGLDEMRDVMSEVPVWAEGLPIASTGFVAKRYRK
jgi:DNA polymerase bacteriophage-type